MSSTKLFLLFFIMLLAVPVVVKAADETGATTPEATTPPAGETTTTPAADTGATTTPAAETGETGETTPEQTGTGPTKPGAANGLEARKLEKESEVREIQDISEDQNTPDDTPENPSKLSSGAYFELFPVYYKSDSCYDPQQGRYDCYKPEYGKVWIIGDEIILHMYIENTVDSIIYYSMTREDKDTYTAISNIKLNIEKSYGFVNDEQDIQELKDDYNFEIEKSTPYSLEKWYEFGRVNGYIDHYRNLYLESLQLNITKVYESKGAAYIQGKNDLVAGLVYTENKIPSEYHTPPSVGAKETYSGNVYITNIGIVAKEEDDVFGFGDIEAYILSNKIMIYSNLSKSFYEGEKININIVLELSIEKDDKKVITKVNPYDEKKFVGFVGNQQTADYLNDTFGIIFEVNKIYDYSYWTSKDNDMTYFINLFKPSFIGIGERLKDKSFYKRAGKVYADGVAFVGQPHDGDSLPDNIPTLSPSSDISSHIVINMVMIMIIMLLLV